MLLPVISFFFISAQGLYSRTRSAKVDRVRGSALYQWYQHGSQNVVVIYQRIRVIFVHLEHHSLNNERRLNDINNAPAAADALAFSRPHGEMEILIQIMCLNVILQVNIRALLKGIILKVGHGKAMQNTCIYSGRTSGPFKRLALH